MKRYANRYLPGLVIIVLFTMIFLGSVTASTAIGENAQSPLQTEVSTQEQDAPQTQEEALVPTGNSPEPVQESSNEPAQEPIKEPVQEPTNLLADELEYILTVIYTDELGILLPINEILPENPIKVKLSAGAYYTVELPVIQEHSCTVSSKEVIMSTHDEEITIVYTTESIPEIQELNLETDEKVKLDNHLDELSETDGPYVAIRCDIGTEAQLGDSITLIAELHGFNGLKVGYQWQRYDGKEWNDIEGEISNTYVFSRLDSSAFGDWRVMVNVLP
jgi:hypothetical protein